MSMEPVQKQRELRLPHIGDPSIKTMMGGSKTTLATLDTETSSIVSGDTETSMFMVIKKTDKPSQEVLEDSFMQSENADTWWEDGLVEEKNLLQPAVDFEEDPELEFWDDDTGDLFGVESQADHDDHGGKASSGRSRSKEGSRGSQRRNHRRSSIASGERIPSELSEKEHGERKERSRPSRKQSRRSSVAGCENISAEHDLHQERSRVHRRQSRRASALGATCGTHNDDKGERGVERGEMPMRQRSSRRSSLAACEHIADHNNEPKPQQEHVGRTRKYTRRSSVSGCGHGFSSKQIDGQVSERKVSSRRSTRRSSLSACEDIAARREHSRHVPEGKERSSFNNQDECGQKITAPRRAGSGLGETTSSSPPAKYDHNNRHAPNHSEDHDDDSSVFSDDSEASDMLDYVANAGHDDEAHHQRVPTGTITPTSEHSNEGRGQGGAPRRRSVVESSSSARDQFMGRSNRRMSITAPSDVEVMKGRSNKTARELALRGLERHKSFARRGSTRMLSTDSGHCH